MKIGLVFQVLLTINCVDACTLIFMLKKRLEAVASRGTIIFISYSHTLCYMLLYVVAVSNSNGVFLN